MKKQNTRRALWMSFVSLLLCATMFIGTTYAWFTDSVTSANNIIKSGNLDVALSYRNDEVTTWTEVDADTNIFKADALWEPGHTEVIQLKIANVGSLALKYRLGINIAKEEGSINGENEAFLLSDYIYFGVVEGEQSYDRAGAVAAVDSSAKQIKSGTTIPGTLEPNLGTESERIVTLVVYMPTTVGNEANYKKGAPVPTIELGLNLFATQAESESDSFGSDYDKEAAWTGMVDIDWYAPEKDKFTLTSAEELAGLAALVNGTATASAATYAVESAETTAVSFKDKTIKLGADIDLNGMAWTPIGTISNGFCGTFDGNNHTVSNFTVTAENRAGLFGYALGGGNVMNLKVENATITANDYAGAIMGQGYTDIENCHVKNVTVITTPYQKADGSYDGGAKAGGVIGHMLEGGSTVKNCSATDVKIYAFRDLGGVVGMVHSNNSASDNKATNVTLGYILCDQITADKNENAGAIYGRVHPSAASVSPAKDDAENQAYTQVYAVYDVNSLTSLANEVNRGNTFEGKTVVMIDDIDLCGASWTPIGRTGESSTDFTYAFRGTFDGQGHKVYNLNVSNTGWAGLFGIVYQGEIKNVSVVGATINSNRMAGTIVGQIYGSIDNCHVTDATITVVPNASGDSYDNGDKVGGIVGWIGDNNNYRTLTNCSVTNASITAYRDLGGIAGYAAYSTTISDNCVTNVTLTADQTTNFYGEKDANANAIWGRNSVGNNNVGITSSNNTDTEVTIVVKK